MAIVNDPVILDDLILHRDRMKLVDGVSAIDDRHAVCQARLREGGPLQAAEGVSPLLSVELVAQSVAILIGWRSRHERLHGGAGWLVGVREARLQTEPLPLGADLEIEVTLLSTWGTYATAVGTVRLAGAEVAEVEVQVFRPTE